MQNSSQSVQNVRLNENPATNIMNPTNIPQMETSQKSQEPSPPPFLSGVPMVNPGNFATPVAVTQQSVISQSADQIAAPQSFVSTAVSYSTSK